jgi:hypothetical protein
MTDQRKKSWRSLLVTATVVMAGAMLGISAVPSMASADVGQGWSCYGSDECHDGSAPCCSKPDGGHCSTSCPIVIH